MLCSTRASVKLQKLSFMNVFKFRHRKRFISIKTTKFLMKYNLLSFQISREFNNSFTKYDY